MEDRRGDILGDKLTVILAYGLPAAAIVASATFTMAPAIRGGIWALALLIMSGACLMNALRCGRVHCYYTAPFFLVMAVASARYGISGAPFGASGWNALAGVTLVGGIALYYFPERKGRYRGD